MIHHYLRYVIAWWLAAGVIGCGRVDLATSGMPSTATELAEHNQTTTEPIMAAPTPAPTPTYNPPLTMGKLEATLKKFENGKFLGIGKAVAYVEVKNPTAMSLKATVTVQFTDGGKPVADHLQTKEVEVAPGEVQEHIFTDSSWKIDNATITVTSPGEPGQ